MPKIILTLFFLFCFSFITAQSGISVSAKSQFNIGQTILSINEANFQAVDYHENNHALTLAIQKGKKFRLGTMGIKAKFSYSINNINYNLENFSTYNNTLSTRSKNIIPELEFWYVLMQRQNLYIYSSFGNYGVLSKLDVDLSDSANSDYNFKKIIPYLRLGLQIDLGRFFLNPFINLEMEGFEFDEIGDFLEIDYKDQINKNTIRSGLELGIFF